MRSRLISMLVVAAVVTSACGGGDDGQQGEVADLFVELAEDGGVDVDVECVVDVVGGLSDDDAALIVEAGTEGSADISEAAEAVIEETRSCVDVDSYRESIVSQFDADSSVDTDCLRSELEGATTVEQISEQAVDAARSCSG